MSDVVIRNMDMPKTCKECIEMEIPVRCRVIKQEPVTAIMTGYNRPKDCPLVELPPHGRWQTGEPTDSGLYLVCIRYNFKDYHTTAEYVEPYNPHTGWYNLKPPYDVNGEEWNKRKDLEVIAWQKIEPYRGQREDANTSD